MIIEGEGNIYNYHLDIMGRRKRCDLSQVSCSVQAPQTGMTWLLRILIALSMVEKNKANFWMKLAVENEKKKKKERKKGAPALKRTP